MVTGTVGTKHISGHDFSENDILPVKLSEGPFGDLNEGGRWFLLLLHRKSDRFLIKHPDEKFKAFQVLLMLRFQMLRDHNPCPAIPITQGSRLFGWAVMYHLIIPAIPPQSSGGPALSRRCIWASLSSHRSPFLKWLYVSAVPHIDS